MPLIADSGFRIELVLLLVAAIIGGINKLLETSRTMRRKSAERQRQRESGGGVLADQTGTKRPAIDIGKPKPARPRAGPRGPQRAEDEVQLPIPDFDVPLPVPEALAPRPEIRNVETAERRPRPPKPRLQLGTAPMPPPRPIARRRRKLVPQRPLSTRARALGLGDRKRVREAIVLREVLGPPLALRGLRPR